MGKRGPQPGTKYRKRPLTARAVIIGTDGQLVAAQRFNERLDAVLDYLDNHLYPVNRIDARLLSRFQGAAEAIQSAVIEGIADYYARDEREFVRALARMETTRGAALLPSTSDKEDSPAFSEEEADEEAAFSLDSGNTPFVLGTLDNGE